MRRAYVGLPKRLLAKLLQRLAPELPADIVVSGITSHPGSDLLLVYLESGAFFEIPEDCDAPPLRDSVPLRETEGTDAEDSSDRL